MSEVAAVSKAIDWWLREELRTSHEGRNSVLDDYSLDRPSLESDLSHSANRPALKAAGHYSRFKMLTNLVFEGMRPNEDWPSAKVIHHALMFTSGAFREQAMLQASSQTEYEDRRYGRMCEFGGAVSPSLDIEEVVEQGLALGFEDMDGIVPWSLDINEAIYRSHEPVSAWFGEHPNRSGQALTDEEVPVVLSVERQANGLLLAVGHVAFAASRRGGDFTQVPFLEPKSISDVATTPIYPIGA